MRIANSGGFLSTERCLPCTPEEERETIKELMREADANLKEGDLFYLISARWWRIWQAYVGLEGNSRLPNLSYHTNKGNLQNPCRPGQMSNSELLSEEANRVNNNGLPNLSDNTNKGYLQISCRPGQINNSELLLEEANGANNEPILRKNMQEELDYFLVHRRVWKKLKEWYKGGPEIPRKVISEGIISRNFRVEVYPLNLQLIDARDNSRRTIVISRKASVKVLYDEVCKLLKLDQAKVLLWDYFNKEKHVLNNYDLMVEEAKLLMDQEILVELKVDGLLTSSFGIDSTGNGMAVVPMETSRLSTTIAGGPTLSNGFFSGFGSSFLRDMEDGYDMSSNGTKIDGRGLAGLQNLGNTCFMNSAIQCLVHTPPLMEYFLQDYNGEINTKNPLGMQGELVLSFGELLRKLWSSGRTAVAPRTFKTKLARFAPQFSGYNQHDSQELLAFLLDGLHEDLNRVKNKPYIDVKDSDGLPDEEVANECWQNHKARNDSIIVDVCQGQYKSTLVCPVCCKISVTFDPFMYLSLPLPSTMSRSMNVTVFTGDGSALPMPFTVNIPKHGSSRDLIRALSSACFLKSNEALLLAEVFDHHIYRYLDNLIEPLSNIKDEEHFVAYKLPANHEDLMKLEIVHVKAESFLPDYQYNFHQKLIGTPLVTCLEKNSKTGADIQAAVATVLKPLMRRKDFSPTQDNKVCKNNGSGPSLDAIIFSDNAPCSSGQDLSISNMEVENGDELLSPFQIALTHDKRVSRMPIDNNYTFHPESVPRIALGWSEREFDFYDFSYLENLPEICKSGFMAKKTRQEAFTLFSCLEAFLKEEPLGPDDMWYCLCCKEHRQATKKLDMWRLPQILVVHLKRFFYSQYLKNKLDTFVNFPVHNLDLSKYVSSKATTQTYLYELYAVSNHYGGLGGGHYTAYAKLIEDDSWYHFDDGHVSPASEDSIKTPAAYVLFYRQVKVNSRDSTAESSSR